MIKLTKDLQLPVDIVTQTVGILAKRRAGKSYTARRLAEQLIKAKQQVVIVDPKGDWWGIRSSSDGKSPGLPVVILGGERGDVPLEVGAGEIVAKLVVEERVSVQLDLSLLRKHEVATFMTTFMENLYRLKAREVYRTPFMLILDEADAIAPQSPMKGEERMLGAAEDIVRRGGQRGIGCTMITQRSAVLNKNVLTQIQILACLRTIASHDLKAVNAWVDVHGSDEERKTLMDSLPSLPIGDAWFWSPGWPTTDGIFQRAHVLPIETFDSGATPKPGERRREPKNLADVDLDVLKKQMAETIERAKADDPKLLKQRIKALELENLKLHTEPPPKSSKPGKEVPVLSQADLKKVRIAAEDVKLQFDGAKSHLHDRLNEAGRQIDSRLGIIDERVKRIETVLQKLERLDKVETKPVSSTALIKAAGTLPARLSARPPARPPVDAAIVLSGKLGRLHFMILTALAQNGAMTKSRLLTYIGYAASGTVSRAFADMLKAGWLTSPSPHVLETTTLGLQVLGPFDPLPTGKELRDQRLQHPELTRAGRAILETCFKCYPEMIAKGDILLELNYKASGTMSAEFAKLIRLGWLEQPRPHFVKASDVFYKE